MEKYYFHLSFRQRIHKDVDYEIEATNENEAMDLTKQHIRSSLIRLWGARRVENISYDLAETTKEEIVSSGKRQISQIKVGPRGETLEWMVMIA